MADSYRCSEGEREDRASGVVPVSGPNRAKQLWSRLKRYVLRLSSGSSSARSQREYSRRKALDAIASGTIQTEVSPGDAFAPLQRQGSLDHYSFATLSLRQRLRNEPDVAALIRKQWMALSFSSADFPDERLLPMLVYFSFFTHCAKLLVPDARERLASFGDENVLRTHLTLSWAAETGSDGIMGPIADNMTFAQFYKSYFELLDTWTLTTQVEEYVRLATELYWEAPREVEPPRTNVLTLEAPPPPPVAGPVVHSAPTHHVGVELVTQPLRSSSPVTARQLPQFHQDAGADRLTPDPHSTAVGKVKRSSSGGPDWMPTSRFPNIPSLISSGHDESTDATLYVQRFYTGVKLPRHVCHREEVVKPLLPVHTALLDSPSPLLSGRFDSRPSSASAARAREPLTPKGTPPMSRPSSASANGLRFAPAAKPDKPVSPVPPLPVDTILTARREAPADVISPRASTQKPWNWLAKIDNTAVEAPVLEMATLDYLAPVSEPKKPKKPPANEAEEIASLATSKTRARMEAALKRSVESAPSEFINDDVPVPRGDIDPLLPEESDDEDIGDEFLFDAFHEVSNLAAVKFGVDSPVITLSEAASTVRSLLSGVEVKVTSPVVQSGIEALLGVVPTQLSSSVLQPPAEAPVPASLPVTSTTTVVPPTFPGSTRLPPSSPPLASYVSSVDDDDDVNEIPGVEYVVNGRKVTLAKRTASPGFGTWDIDHTRFEIKGILGRGSYGAVAEAFDHVTGTRVAVKQIKDIFSVFENGKRIFREITLLRNMNHQNIVKLVHVQTPSNPGFFTDLYLVFECADLDLNKLGKDVAKIITVGDVRKITYQLLKAMRYIHSGGIIHRDIKPANVLISKGFDVLLCDFGLARGRESGDSDAMDVAAVGGGSGGGAVSLSLADAPQPKALKRALTRHVVTRWYRAPELPLYNDGRYEAPIDMWSVGCVFAELLGMTSPGDSRRSLPLFPGTSCLPLSRGASTVAPMGAREKLKKDQLNVIFDVIGTPTPAQLASIRTVEAKAYLKSLESRPPSNLGEKYPTAPPEAIDLLFRLLSLIPEDRITAEEALAHPFLAPVRDESTEIPFASSLRFQSVTRLSLRAEMLKEIALYNPHPPVPVMIREPGGRGGGSVDLPSKPHPTKRQVSFSRDIPDSPA